ncbi:MAG: hypothetical protein ABFQ64_05210 [Campylobacterota bacterium]
MRFTLIKDLKQDSMMKPILGILLLFTLLYLVSDIFVKSYSFGLFEKAIKTTLFGNVDEFIDPLTTSSFLEFWHMEIFFIMMILLTLSAVYIRLSGAQKFNILIVNAVMIPALFSLVSLALSFFLYPELVRLYVLSFFTWHTSAIYMSLYSLIKLYYD